MAGLPQRDPRTATGHPMDQPGCVRTPHVSSHGRGGPGAQADGWARRRFLIIEPQVRAFGNPFDPLRGRRVPHASRAAREPPAAGPRRGRRPGVSLGGGAARPAWGYGFRPFRVVRRFPFTLFASWDRLEWYE